jgi:hypothetical protein
MKNRAEKISENTSSIFKSWNGLSDQTTIHVDREIDQSGMWVSANKMEESDERQSTD